MDIATLMHSCERCHVIHAIPQELVGRKDVLHCGVPQCQGTLRVMRDGGDMNEGWYYRESGR